MANAGARLGRPAPGRCGPGSPELTTSLTLDMPDTLLTGSVRLREVSRTIPRRPAGHPPVVLTIAGSDPSGGAGIQADLKTFAALDAYGCAVLTALTAQATTGVTGVHAVPAGFVREQVETLVADVSINAVKIGMLASADIVDEVHRLVVDVIDCPVVLDPVMISTAGSRLLDADAIASMTRLAPACDLITPNLHETAVLLGTDVARDVDEQREQAAALVAAGIPRALVKGGHGDGPEAIDVLVGPEGEQLLRGPRIATRNSHGTGCTLSSAIAALRPVSRSWAEAVSGAKDYLTTALSHADELAIGRGPGPVHHAAAARRHPA